MCSPRGNTGGACDHTPSSRSSRCTPSRHRRDVLRRKQAGNHPPTTTAPPTTTSPGKQQRRYDITRADPRRESCFFARSSVDSLIVAFVDEPGGLNSLHKKHTDDGLGDWRPTELDGYPAVTMVEEDDTDCTFAVGISDSLYFSVFVSYDMTCERSRPMARPSWPTSRPPTDVTSAGCPNTCGCAGPASARRLFRVYLVPPFVAQRVRSCRRLSHNSRTASATSRSILLTPSRYCLAVSWKYGWTWSSRVVVFAPRRTETVSYRWLLASRFPTRQGISRSDGSRPVIPSSRLSGRCRVPRLVRGQEEAPRLLPCRSMRSRSMGPKAVGDLVLGVLGPLDV